MDQLSNIIDFIEKNELIAFPTDTVFGLAASPCNDSAVDKIYTLKHREKQNKLALLGADIEAFSSVAVFDERALTLAELFWPGALTLILPLHPDHQLSSLVTDGGDTIAVRTPKHDTALAILRAYGKPLATTSVNLSGQPPLLDSDSVERAFGHTIGYIAPGTCSSDAVSSTIVDLTSPSISILREGTVTEEAIYAALAA